MRFFLNILFQYKLDRIFLSFLKQYKLVRILKVFKNKLIISRLVKYLLVYLRFAYQCHVEIYKLHILMDARAYVEVTLLITT